MSNRLPGADQSSTPAAVAADTATALASQTGPAKSSTDVPFYGTPLWVHYGCMAVTILGPISLMMPPRRANLRSLGLIAGTFVGTSQLTFDYTGTSLYSRFQTRKNNALGSMSGDLPEPARQRQAAMKAERERRQRIAAGLESDKPEVPAQRDVPEWVKERSRKEKEVFESGGGYWDLILDQISGVLADLTPKKKGDDDTPPKEKK